MEAHPPYDPPEAVLAAQLGGAPRPNAERVNAYMQVPTRPMPDSLLPDAWALYNAEVASVDAAIGRLLDGLRTRGVLDHAVVVFLADHGEEFKEHGLMGHHQTLYEEVIRVPLIIATTGRPAHREVDELVSLIDVAPTVLELIGGTAPPQFEGRSRARAVGAAHWWTTFGASPAAVTRPVFSELIRTEDTLRLSSHERAVVTGGTKLIAGNAGERMYYDLHTDPGETNPDGVAPAQRPALDSGLAQLQSMAVRGATPTAPAIDDETREHMRALGYGD
jgi:arylsulfatase A-like enzyme